MIGSKVVLTYKRKRFSSRPGLGFENECPEQSPGCQTLEILKATIKEEEESIHESLRRDPEFAACNGDSNVLQCKYCRNFYNVQGLVPSNEHLNGKKLCSTCVKQQDRLCPLEAVRNSCEDTMKVKKPGFPLITFSRRSRHKKNVDGNGMQEKSTVVEKYDLVAVKSNSTTDNGCLLDLSTDLTGNDSSLRYCAASQEKKTSEDVDLRDVDSLSVPKIKLSEKVTNEELTTGSCILKDIPLISEASEKSPTDAVSHINNKQVDVSQSHVSAADESRIISSSVLESAKITNGTKRDESSLASFDLSKPPAESSSLVDCNLTLESSFNVQIDHNISENHRDSTESTSRSNSIVLHECPSSGRVLDLLDERIGETSLSQAHCVPARLFNSSHVSAPDLPSVSTGQSQTSKKNFLQLFPEDRLNDTLPLKNPIKETSFIHHQDRPSILTSNGKHLHFRSSTSSTPINLSLPIEIRNREPVPDLTGSQYPSDPVSLMRHKMMLDSIINKARAVNSKKRNFTDNFDFPNVWSEDELDFLWIGVRRHGVGSWDSILRDPRLHFSSWRSPRELAEQWEEEQVKLLSPNPSQTKHFKPAKKYNPNFVEEPQLSLGSKGRSTFQSSLINGPTVATNGNLTSNLPHWLREVVSYPPSRPVEPTAIPSVSYTGHSGLMQWINQPFSGSNRTIGMMNKMAPELQPPLVQPAAGLSISKPDEVIVINSDASSEETISDDHT